MRLVSCVLMVGVMAMVFAFFRVDHGQTDCDPYQATNDMIAQLSE